MQNNDNGLQCRKCLLTTVFYDFKEQLSLVFVVVFLLSGSIGQLNGNQPLNG